MIPNYSGTAPASSDSRWIEDLTLDLEIQLYDCSIDFDISDLSMLDVKICSLGLMDTRYIR